MRTYSVLFIGNSYTFYNNMTSELFTPLARTAGVNVEVDTVLKGGYKLEFFADPANECGALVEKALTGEKKYDYVVLQEHSLRPAAQPEKFYEAVRNLVARVRAHGAEPVLYSTWGRKSGSVRLDEYGWTNKSMTRMLAEAYRTIGDELGVKVAHVGLAFYDVYTSKNDIELYDPDKTHPSREGSYLAAATIFAKIFDKDVREVEFDGGISEKTAKILRAAAHRAVLER